MHKDPDVRTAIERAEAYQMVALKGYCMSFIFKAPSDANRTVSNDLVWYGAFETSAVRIKMA